MTGPYYQQDGITIWHADFRQVAQPPGAVTVTDSPYGETSLSWDRWPDGWPALIEGDEMWCFGSMRMFLEHASEFASWRFAQDVVWEKHTGSGFTTDRFRRVHEHATHWYRGEWGNLLRATPRPETNGAINKSVVHHGQPPHTGKLNRGDGYVDDGRRLMRSVISVPSCHGYAVNETQKPTGIIIPLLAYSCAPDAVVFDPFMGSGSTLVAARARGLRAVGCDVREDQCEAAANRLSQGVLDLFDPSPPRVVTVADCGGML